MAMSWTSYYKMTAVVLLLAALASLLLGDRVAVLAGPSAGSWPAGRHQHNNGSEEPGMTTDLLDGYDTPVDSCPSDDDVFNALYPTDFGQQQQPDRPASKSRQQYSQSDYLISAGIFV